MKRIVFVLFALALVAGCSAAPVKDCPPCPEPVAQRCLPEKSDKVFCHMRFFFKVGDEFEPVFIPTECDPKCVDGDGIKIEPCP